MTALLTLDAITFKRGSFALGPLSLQLAAGERLWLAGPNGCGKSTLLAIIAGLQGADDGSVQIGGVAIDHLHPWQRPCSVLLQQLGLWPHLTIRKQCLLAGGSSDSAAQLTALADALHVTPLLDRRPGELSGGEAQRCALVRTLMRDTPLAILDEPYAAQHDRGIEYIDAVLDRLAAAGKAVIVAGHRQPPQARRWDLHGATATSG